MNAPPPPILGCFDSAQALIEAIPDHTREAFAAEISALVARELPPAVSIATVSTLFGVSPSFVAALSRKPNRYYRLFKIRKGKKTRQIQAPKVALKLLQRWIGAHIAHAIELPSCVFGFVPGKNGVIQAAQIHCGARWVYSLDLRDFFPNIAAFRFRQPLRELGYSEQALDLITNLCTLNGSLPQGSPASPVLSNLAFGETDHVLQTLALAAKVRYTRYADDLVFSGLGEVPDGFIEEVRGVLKQHVWEIAEDKEYLACLPARLKVHGLLVNGITPRLTKGYRNRIRAYRHLLSSGKISADDLNAVRGHIAYAELVEKHRLAFLSA